MSTVFEIPESLLRQGPTPPPPPVDDHRVEDLVNRFIAGKQDALFVAPDAFYRLEGADAVDGRPAISQRLQALRTTILDQARDDGERTALGPRLDLHIDDAMDGVDRHVTRQREVHQRQIISERQRLILRGAELEHDNDNKITALADANASAALERARMDGVAPNSPEESGVVQQARSQVLRTAISERIANHKGPQALTLFDRVKDELSPADLRRLDVPIEAAVNEAAVDAWLQREEPHPRQLLAGRIRTDPLLSPDQKAIATMRVLAHESARESARVAAVMGLDDQFASAQRMFATSPASYEAGTFAKLAGAYAAAGEPETAEATHRVASHEAFLGPFAQASPDMQQRMIETLPEGDVRDHAIAIQQYQADAFERDPFAAGTALYNTSGRSEPAANIEGRIHQARQIAQLRGGIAVSPFTVREIGELRQVLDTGSNEDKQAVRALLAAVPVDMQPSVEAQRQAASTDGSALPLPTRSVTVEATHGAPAQTADAAVDGDAAPPPTPPTVTAQVLPPTIIPGRLPPIIRPVPPTGRIPTPEGMTPLEQLPRGSSGGENAGKPFDGSNTYPEGTPCLYCSKPTTNRPGSQNSLEREHIVPRKQNGNNEPENKAPACRTCNRRKGPRTPREWYWRLSEMEA